MENIRYIQVNKKALIELIQDENSKPDFDYQITKDNKNNETSFSLLNTQNNIILGGGINNNNQQLFVINEQNKTYGIINEHKYSFFNTNQYTNNQPSQYDKVKIWLPINYNLEDVQGLALNIYTLDYSNKNKINLANYFYDKNVANTISSLQLSDRPFRMNNVLWGKYIEIYIPNVEYETTVNTNNNSTINKRLGGQGGMSITAPLYFDFRFLYQKNKTLDETTYRLTSQQIFSTPQTSNSKKLSVSIRHADDGDYFIINGLYNNNPIDLDTYMDMKKQSGDDSYILYTVTLYEDNIPQSTRNFYIYENYSQGINDYRPVIKYTNTLAQIEVHMQIISIVTDVSILKTTTYSLKGNDVAKYGKKLSSINVNGVIKPKIYNSAPVKIELSNPKIIKTFNTKTEPVVGVKYISYPILFDNHNVGIKDLTNTTDNSINAYGELIIMLTPFDNVFKFNIIKNLTNNKFDVYDIPTNSIVTLNFVSDNKKVRINLYEESNMVDLSKGIVVFKIDEDDLNDIKDISKFNKNWYITVNNNNDTETVLYMGTFTFKNSVSETTSLIGTMTSTIKPLLKPVLNPVTLKPVVKQIQLNPTLINNTIFNKNTNIITKPTNTTFNLNRFNL